MDERWFWLSEDRVKAEEPQELALRKYSGEYSLLARIPLTDFEYLPHSSLHDTRSLLLPAGEFVRWWLRSHSRLPQGLALQEARRTSEQVPWAVSHRQGPAGTTASACVQACAKERPNKAIIVTLNSS